LQFTKKKGGGGCSWGVLRKTGVPVVDFLLGERGGGSVKGKKGESYYTYKGKGSVLGQCPNGVGGILRQKPMTKSRNVPEKEGGKTKVKRK